MAQKLQYKHNIVVIRLLYIYNKVHPYVENSFNFVTNFIKLQNKTTSKHIVQKPTGNVASTSTCSTLKVKGLKCGRLLKWIHTGSSSEKLPAAKVQFTREIGGGDTKNTSTRSQIRVWHPGPKESTESFWKNSILVDCNLIGIQKSFIFNSWNENKKGKWAKVDSESPLHQSLRPNINSMHVALHKERLGK